MNRNTSSERQLEITSTNVTVCRRFVFVKLWPQMSVVTKHGGPLQHAFKELLQIFVNQASEEALPLAPGHSTSLKRTVSKPRGC